jgi:hypothetical protein
MIGLIRLAVFGFIALTVLYFLVVIYSRSVRREKLENEWAAKGALGDRDDFVNEGLKQYERSARRKLIVAVYIVPIVVVGGLIYILNFM